MATVQWSNWWHLTSFLSLFLLFTNDRLVDDLGYNGVGYHNKGLHTPTIDAIAAAGVKLDGFCK